MKHANANANASSSIAPMKQLSSLPALSLLCALAVLAACAAAPQPGASPAAVAGTAKIYPESLAQARAGFAPESPECLSPKIKKPEPMPVSLIPESVLKQAKSGWSAVRYDLVNGKVANLGIVASNPAGLYDSYALAHAARYVDSSGANAKGCYMTVDIKF